ncbi:MAG: hypothetical protein EOP94_00160 [Zymomonas sp.]|nr:MAG: hypothetical protein EOP94_00160 [Zymomonas sp.]
MAHGLISDVIDPIGLTSSKPVFTYSFATSLPNGFQTKLTDITNPNASYVTDSSTGFFSVQPYAIGKVDFAADLFSEVANVGDFRYPI